MFRYASYPEPARAAVLQRVLAIPEKRTGRAVASFLSTSEIDSLVAAPDRTRWIGRRDYAVLGTAVRTGPTRVRTRRAPPRRHRARHDSPFPTRRGTTITADAIGDLVDRCVAIARRNHPDWTAARVTPLTLFGSPCRQR